MVKFLPLSSFGTFRSKAGLSAGSLGDPSVGTIIVEHRERLCRFGFEYIEAALSARGARILVVDDGEVEDDLVRDATEVMTSLCARLYGKRSARRRAERAVAAAGEL